MYNGETSLALSSSVLLIFTRRLLRSYIFVLTIHQELLVAVDFVLIPLLHTYTLHTCALFHAGTVRRRQGQPLLSGHTRGRLLPRHTEEHDLEGACCSPLFIASVVSCVIFDMFLLQYSLSDTTRSCSGFNVTKTPQFDFMDTPLASYSPHLPSRFSTRSHEWPAPHQPHLH